jgi:hypothetical protein
MYVKLFSAILDSSVWSQPTPVRIVWITLLAMADREGYVWASPGGLARRACLPHGDCCEAIRLLSSPDPEDSSGHEEGRRIVAFQGGWRIVNYLRYRDMADADVRRDQVRQAVQRHRTKAKGVIIGNQTKASVTPSEAEADTDTEKTAPLAALAALPQPAVERPTANGHGARKHPNYPDAFERWWAVYPRRVGKAAASKAHARAVAEGVAPERLQAAAVAYATAVAAWPAEDRRFVPHPATWINRGSYDDDPAAWERQTGAMTDGDRRLAQRRAAEFQEPPKAIRHL